MPSKHDAPVLAVVIKEYTKARLTDRLLRDPEMSDIIMAAVEGAGGEIGPGVSWRLRLAVVMERVDREEGAQR